MPFSLASRRCLVELPGNSLDCNCSRYLPELYPLYARARSPRDAAGCRRLDFRSWPALITAGIFLRITDGSAEGWRYGRDARGVGPRNEVNI